MSLNRVAELARWGLRLRKVDVVPLADRARDAQQWELAAELYREALDRNPDDSPIWVQYGHALKEAGQLRDPNKLAQSEAAYRNALSLDPDEPDTHLQLGHILKIRGKMDEANAAYLRAFALDPSMPHPLNELATLGWSAGHLAEIRALVALKLFTTIYDDARLLRPFLKHYNDLGIKHFFIAVAPQLSSMVNDFTAGYNVTVFDGLDVESHMLGGTAAVTEMRRLHQDTDEWVVIVDLDEFIETKRELKEVISAADYEGSSVVRGIMYDRFSFDGRLADVRPAADPAQVFPVEARFIRDVMGGNDNKGVLVKGRLRAITGHHKFEGEILSPTVLKLNHYEWCTGAIGRLSTRYAKLLQAGIAFAGEYKKILDHYEQHGRFAWEEFGGVVRQPDESATGLDEVAVPATVHPRDIAAADLGAALAASDRPELLRELVDISRRAFGFYVGQFSYTINYPWAAARLEGVKPGSRVLDVGSGLSPLPLWLAKRAVLVDCVDSHPIVRIPPISDDWNEWGFFDYGQLHPGLTSHHCTIAEFTPMASFDAIYSVCVLAHMPRAVREDTLRRCREWLSSGGILLLALDLISATDFLWNRSGGREVESPVKHGTHYDVLCQLANLGFQLKEVEVIRTIYRWRTDLLLIHCVAM